MSPPKPSVSRWHPECERFSALKPPFVNELLIESKAVTKNQKPWLQTVPWDSVVTLNKALCQAQNLEALTNPQTLAKARQLWEGAVQKKLTVREAFEVCHDCYDLVPFTFNSGNTFAAIGRTLVEDYLKQMPPVESQIIRTTIGHYIVGLINARELKQVLRHFEEVLEKLTIASPVTERPATPVADRATV